MIVTVLNQTLPQLLELMWTKTNLVGNRRLLMAKNVSAVDEYKVVHLK